MAQKFDNKDDGANSAECLEKCERQWSTRYDEYLQEKMSADVELDWSSEGREQPVGYNYSDSSSEDLMEVEDCSDWNANDPQCLDWRDEEEDDCKDFSFAIVDSEICPSRSAIVEPDDHYSEEYYEWNRVLEGKCPKDPLVNQPQVRRGDRATLLAWLSKVIRSLDLFPETLFLTANIIDRFLVCTPIALECLQLLGLSAMFVAAKQLEISHPSLKELVKLGADVYCKQHFLQMERIILKRLQFNLVVATSLFFVEYYITCQPLPNERRRCRRNFINLLERPHRMLVRNLVELGVQDYNLCRYAPSCVALSSMAVVEEYVSGQPIDLTGSRYARWAHAPSSLKQCTTDIWSHLSKVLPGSIRDLSADTFFERFQPSHKVT